MEFDDLSHWQAAMFIKQHQSDLKITVKEVGFVPLYKQLPSGKQQQPAIQSEDCSDTETEGSVCQHRSCHSSMDNFEQFMDEPEAEDIYQNVTDGVLEQPVTDIDCQLAALQQQQQPPDPVTDIDAILDISDDGGDGDDFNQPAEHRKSVQSRIPPPPPPPAAAAEPGSAADATSAVAAAAASKRLANRQVSSLRIRRSASRRSGGGGGGDQLSLPMSDQQR
uniref:DBR1 domain-containing protein n=1 Tax=Macrostomum lignano TaxID=282301 RepID=A0A1I8ILW6_9PLAT